MGKSLLEFAVGVKPGDLVFVLVGHEFVMIAGDSFAQSGLPAHCAILGRAHTRYEISVAVCVSAVLIRGEVDDAACNDLVEVFGEDTIGGAFGLRPGDALDGFKIDGGSAAPQEGVLVALHGDAVKLDCPPQRFLRYGDHAALPGIAEHEHVGGNRIAHQGGGDAGGIDEFDRIVADRLADMLAQGLGRKLQVRLVGEVGGRRLIGVDDRASAGLAHLGQRVVAAGGNHIAADDRIGLARGDANSVDILGLLGDADVG